MILSKEKRQLELITISSFDNMISVREPLFRNIFPIDHSNSKPRSFQFSKDKPIIFISARVHPGETPSSFLMNGMLKFLVDEDDPRAEILRKVFVFKIVPIINIDGVSRGFYRYDTNSLNMNRHYINPNQKIQPEIYAIRRIFISYAQERKIKYYFDLHAHASSRGLFLFGNSLEFLYQVENCMIPKLIELNCEYLSFNNCNFSEKSMKTKEKGDKFSKEGTGRVHFHKICGIINSYTVEASYFRGLYKGALYEYRNLMFEDLESTLNQANKNFYNKNNMLEKANENKILIKILAKYFKFNLHDFICEKLGVDDINILINQSGYFNTQENNTKDESVKNSLKSSRNNNNLFNDKQFLENRYSGDIESILSKSCNNIKSQIANETPLKNDSSYNNPNLNSKLDHLFYENFLDSEKFLRDKNCKIDNQEFYTPIAYEKMGISLLISVLDYEGLNPFSRISNSIYRDIFGVREAVSGLILNTYDKFKGNIMCTNLHKNINSLKKFTSIYEKLHNKYEAIMDKNNALLIKNYPSEKLRFERNIRLSNNNLSDSQKNFKDIFSDKVIPNFSNSDKIIIENKSFTKDIISANDHSAFQQNNIGN